MKGLLVTPNQTVIPDTHPHVLLGRTRIADGPGLDHVLDQEAHERVHLTPDQRDHDATEDPAPKGRTITILIEDLIGVPHAESEGALALAQTELETALTPRMTKGRQGPGQAIPVDCPPIQAHIKSRNHLPTQNRRNYLNRWILLTLRSWIKEHNSQSQKGLRSDFRILIHSASALLIWTPVTVNLAPVTRQRPAANPLLPARIPTLKHTRNGKKRAPVIPRQITRGNSRPLTKAVGRRRTVKTH